MLPKIKDKRYNTRSTDEYENFPRPNEKYYKSFFPHFTRSWNNLDKEIREDRDHHNFKEQIKIRLEPPRHPHYKYGDKYANNLINFFFLLNQFLKIQVIEAMPSYFCSWPNKILQNHLFIPVEAIKSKTRQSKQCGFSIYTFDNVKSKSMVRLVRAEKMVLSGLVFARKIARMILIQNI